MKSVLYVTNIPTPYRSAFFEMFSRDVKLTVAFERRSASNRDRSWAASDEIRPYKVLWLNGRSIGEEFSVSLDLVRHLRKHRYDHVIFGGYNSPTVIFAMLWMRLHRLPYGITCDGMLPKQEPARGPKEGLKRSLISHGDFWISSGATTTRELLRYGARKGRVYEVPFSSVREADLPLTPPDRDPSRARLGCGEKTVFLYVGQFIQRKGLDLLIPAFASYCRGRPDGEALLYLVGGEPRQLEAMGFSQLPEGVRCVPFLSKQELADYYRAADLLVLPTREDVWGLVINEAMSYGLPVLSTDRCVAALELVKPGKTGILVPAGDSKALARGMAQGLELKDRQAVLDGIRRYTIEEMTRRTLEALGKLR